MVDRLKEIPEKILEWWNKFTTRQKTIIISIAAGVILALAILVTLLTRKTYVTLATCETTAEAAEIVDLLESNSLDYKTSTDGTIVSVLDSQESQANLLLGANKITADGYTIDDVTSGGFSTTESDKQKRWVYLLQQKMETDLESNSAVKNATVTLDLPENDGTLISQKTEDLVGPYELHDFFLYYMLRFGFHPEKIFRLARQAFGEEYDIATCYKWLRTFCWRFFAQHFKRSCLPDGPKVGSIAVSPRGDLRMPSDASSAVWMSELDELKDKLGL